jgi:hypothetical protein
MTHFHAVVWLDHHQASIFHFNAGAMDQLRASISAPPTACARSRGEPAGEIRQGCVHLAIRHRGHGSRGRKSAMQNTVAPLTSY